MSHEVINDSENRKVRDHCYYTGLHRGASHSNCNLKYGISYYICIAFCNLSGCDAHLFIKVLGKRFKKDCIPAIAEDKEK